MSWLRRIFKAVRRTPAEQVIAVIDKIIDLAGDSRERYRELITKAAAKGDLDGPFDAFVAANRRAKDYIEEG